MVQKRWKMFSFTLVKEEIPLRKRKLKRRKNPTHMFCTTQLTAHRTGNACRKRFNEHTLSQCYRFRVLSKGSFTFWKIWPNHQNHTCETNCHKAIFLFVAVFSYAHLPHLESDLKRFLSGKEPWHQCAQRVQFLASPLFLFNRIILRKFPIWWSSGPV